MRISEANRAAQSTYKKQLTTAFTKSTADDQNGLFSVNSVPQGAALPPLGFAARHALRLDMIARLTGKENVVFGASELNVDPPIRPERTEKSPAPEGLRPEICAQTKYTLRVEKARGLRLNDCPEPLIAPAWKAPCFPHANGQALWQSGSY